MIADANGFGKPDILMAKSLGSKLDSHDLDAEVLKAMSDVPQVKRKYQGAASYYSRYRPPYPHALVTVLRDTFRLDGKGQLLDLGSGPGSVAIPLAHLFERVVAMDPESDLLREGKEVSSRSGISNIAWVCGSSEDLSPTLGTFRVVTMGESFHWMDRGRTLEALHHLVGTDGGVAILSPRRPSSTATRLPGYRT